MAKHHFHLKADWEGGRNSVGHIDAGQLKTKISIPPEMDGPGIGTNPDEMLLGAAATCYIITLAAMIERAKLPLNEIGMESEAVVDVTKGVFTYQKIIHKPTVMLRNDASPKDLEKLNALAIKAEESCMISKALAGNVEIELEADLKIS